MNKLTASLLGLICFIIEISKHFQKHHKKNIENIYIFDWCIGTYFIVLN